MTPVSDKAFAVMAVCPEAKKYYGITVDYLRKNAYKFVWAFKIDKDKAKREGYASQRVHGSVELDAEYPGCPYCRTKDFVVCNCGKLNCHNGNGTHFTCNWCGLSGTLGSYDGAGFGSGGDI